MDDNRIPTSVMEDEVVTICQDLIRIKSVNFGDGSGPCEREAAEYCAAKLSEVGLEPELFESEPRRANVFVRIPGSDSTRPALVVHGHTDVVPAEPSGWTVDPFSGEIKDGMIWGRGAVDMKNMDAMILAVVREMVRTGTKPQRDLIVAFFADEEAGGDYGSWWTVEHRPELFEGATEAISEVGGFSINVQDKRVYLIQTAEKGMAWLKLIAKGTTGHGSHVNPDNAVTKLAAALTRIGDYEWPLNISKTVDTTFRGVAELLGMPYDPNDKSTMEALLDAMGPMEKFVAATLSVGSNPTMMNAGDKVNTIPGWAEGCVDVRTLPGSEDETLVRMKELAGPDIEIQTINSELAMENDVESELMEHMERCLKVYDPEAVVLPYMCSGGTDNKALSQLGITGYGFTPMRLSDDLDFAAMFHGYDERIPVDALKFGTRVLQDFLYTC